MGPSVSLLVLKTKCECFFHIFAPFQPSDNKEISIQDCDRGNDGRTDIARRGRESKQNKGGGNKKSRYGDLN